MIEHGNETNVRGKKLPAMINYNSFQIIHDRTFDTQKRNNGTHINNLTKTDAVVQFLSPAIPVK
jgi:hypothetical protein